MPSIGSCSRSFAAAASSIAFVVGERAEGLLDAQLLDVGEELVQRRGRAAARRRCGPSITSSSSSKSARCCASSGASGRGLLLRRRREDDLLHERQPVAEELVLGAAQPDALRAGGQGAPRVVGCVRVRVDAQGASLVGPREQPVDPRVVVGHDEVDLADDDRAGGAVDGDGVAGADHGAVDGDGAGARVDGQRGRAAHGGDAEAAGDRRRRG